MAKIVILGLTITSSWGNGHATTYRALVKALNQRGHEVLFLERETPWYCEHRDLPKSPHARIALYHSVADLKGRFAEQLSNADAVIVGSFVPDGIEVGGWAIATATSPVAFYDIDTPVTLGKLERSDCDYLSAKLVSAYDIYLSFTGDLQSLFTSSSNDDVIGGFFSQRKNKRFTYILVIFDDKNGFHVKLSFSQRSFFIFKHISIP